MQIKRIKIAEGVNFTHIPEKKFKTNSIIFNFFIPLDKETVSSNAVLPGILTRSCKKYPNFTEFSKHLEELYSASILPGVQKLGDFQILSVSCTTLEDDLTWGHEKISREAAKLLCEVIFEPDLENNKFKSENLKQERRQLIESIEAEFNDKKVYAMLRLQELMCADEKFGISSSGTIENAKKITPENVFETWKKLLEIAPIEIFSIGSSDTSEVIKKLKKEFGKIARIPLKEAKSQVVEKVKKTREFSEEFDVEQCKLVMGFRSGIARPNEKSYAMQVMTALFGGTPQSKLFRNVREKLSLCYYCRANYNQINGIVFVSSGVETQNIEKTKDEILKQLEEIKLSNFSNSELEETKLLFIQSLEAIKDSPSALASWYILSAFEEEKFSPEEVIEKIKKINRDHVVEAANFMQLDTIYTLKGRS